MPRSLEENYSYVFVKVHICEHPVNNEIHNKISFENVLKHFSNVHLFICDFPNGIVHFRKRTFLKGVFSVGIAKVWLCPSKYKRSK